MKILSRWIAGVLGSLLLPVFGFGIGIVAAFAWTYVFLDEDKTGNADVATNISFMALSVLLGLIGGILGLVGGMRLFDWTFKSQAIGSHTASAVSGEVDR